MRSSVSLLRKTMIVSMLVTGMSGCGERVPSAGTGSVVANPLDSTATLVGPTEHITAERSGSEDGGRAASAPMRRGSPFNLGGPISLGVGLHPQCAIDPVTGELHVAFERDGHILHSKSGDGGTSWCEPKAIPNASCAQRVFVAARAGRAAAVWVDPRSKDIRFAFTSDGGSNWSAPEVIYHDTAGTQQLSIWATGSKQLKSWLVGFGERRLVLLERGPSESAWEKVELDSADGTGGSRMLHPSWLPMRNGTREAISFVLKRGASPISMFFARETDSRTWIRIGETKWAAEMPAKVGPLVMMSDSGTRATLFFGMAQGEGTVLEVTNPSDGPPLRVAAYSLAAGERFDPEIGLSGEALIGYAADGQGNRLLSWSVRKSNAADVQVLYRQSAPH